MTWRDTDSGAADYSLALPFVDQSEPFTQGFEAGWQYGRMKHAHEDRFQQTVHTENQRQLIAAAKAIGWTVRFEPIDETFCEMYAERNKL